MRTRSATLFVVGLALVFGGAVGGGLAFLVRSPSAPSSVTSERESSSRTEVRPSYYPRHLRAADLEPRPALPRRLRLPKALAARFSPWSDPSDDPELAHAPGELPVAHQRLWLGRRVSSLMTYRGAGGDLCVIEDMPPEGGIFHCLDRRRLFRDGAVYVESVSSQILPGNGDGWDLVWVWGIRSSRVTSLEMILSDCSKKPMSVDRDGVFLVVVGPRLLRKGIQPDTLVGRRGDRTIVFRRRVRIAPPNETKTPPKACSRRARGIR